MTRGAPPRPRTEGGTPHGDHRRHHRWHHHRTAREVRRSGRQGQHSDLADHPVRHRRGHSRLVRLHSVRWQRQCRCRLGPLDRGDRGRGRPGRHRLHGHRTEQRPQGEDSLTARRSGCLTSSPGPFRGWDSRHIRARISGGVELPAAG